MTTVTLWGTRGSLACPDPDSLKYGGNTSCVEVQGQDGTVLVLDAGTGIRRLGKRLVGEVGRVDILLTHLHMDHLQGLGFFAPIFIPGTEVHIWGPPSSTQALGPRLARYLSPPLFPVYLRDVPSTLHIHDLLDGTVDIGNFRVTAAPVCHPNPTVGYRIENSESVITYLPDHEPALGWGGNPPEFEWTSGAALAANADVLLHDAQYDDSEYESHIGWGHSSIGQALRFASLVGARALVPFHHDPNHSDSDLDRMLETSLSSALGFRVIPGIEGTRIDPEHA